MPAPRSPNAYAVEFMQLTQHLLEQHPQQFDMPFPTEKLAQRMRFRYYSYLRALDNAAYRAKDTMAAEYGAQAAALRGYEVKIVRLPTAQWAIRFVAREYTEDALLLREAMKNATMIGGKSQQNATIATPEASVKSSVVEEYISEMNPNH